MFRKKKLKMGIFCQPLARQKHIGSTNFISIFFGSYDGWQNIAPSSRDKDCVIGFEKSKMVSDAQFDAYF